MFALVVRFDLRDSDAAATFDALTAAVVEQVKVAEEGTLVYATSTVEDAPLSRVFVEVYADRDAFDAHNDAAHVKEFHASKDPFVVSHRVELLTPGPAKGLPGSA